MTDLRLGCLYLSVATVLVVCKTTVLRQPLEQHRMVAVELSDANPGADATLRDNGSYSMNLTSRGLAVLDSAILFEVQLIPDMARPVILGSDSFIYLWMDMASKQTFTIFDGLKSNICVTFPSKKNVTAGDYLMTVAAYHKDQPTIIVAFQTRKFTLTENLNGHLVLTQKLDYQRDLNTFSTKEPLTLTANVLDQFLQTGLTYEYVWYQGEKCLEKTKSPNYTLSNFSAGNFTLASQITIRTNDTKHSSSDSQTFSGQGSSMTVPGSPLTDLVESQRRTIRSQTSPGTDLQFLVKGMFQQTVTLKDPVRACVVTRVDTDPEDRGINLKQSALVNVTCLGSAPSSICINITSSTTNLPANQTCQPGPFVNKLDYQVAISLPSAGWNDVHFFVYNDISRYQLIESFYGYSPDSANVRALTLPIVFGVLGIIIMILAGAYILRLRKKPMVEVADFDFHPSLTSSQSSEGRFTISRLVQIVRSMFSRDQYETEHKRPLLHKPVTVLSQELYESL